MPETTPRGASPTSEDSDGGFDQIVGKLRGVVERLEAGSLGLEQALAAFEEGVRLSRRGAEILDRAERRVEMLTRSPDGAVVVGQLPPGSGPGDGST